MEFRNFNPTGYEQFAQYRNCRAIRLNRLCYCACAAINLIGKLLEVKIGNRYNVDKSLEHSWLQVRVRSELIA